MSINKLCFAVTPVMPITFDASLSYYETLMKMVGSQNDVIEEVNRQETEIDQIQVDVAKIDQMQEEIVKQGTKIDGIQDNISTLQSTLNTTVSNLNAMNFNYTPAYTDLKITLGENGQISWAQQNTLILIPANMQSGSGLGYSINSGSITVGKSQKLYLYLLTNGTSNSQIVTSNKPPLTINRDIQPAYPNYFALGFVDGINSIFVPYACYYINNKLTYPYENLNNTTLLDELDTTVDSHTTQISGISSQLTTTTNTANSALTTATNAQSEARTALSTANDAASSAATALSRANDANNTASQANTTATQNSTSITKIRQVVDGLSTVSPLPAILPMESELSFYVEQLEGTTTLRLTTYPESTPRVTLLDVNATSSTNRITINVVPIPASAPLTLSMSTSGTKYCLMLDSNGQLRVATTAGTDSYSVCVGVCDFINQSAGYPMWRLFVPCRFANGDGNTVNLAPGQYMELV